MVFWTRIRHSKIQTLANQWKRHYHHSSNQRAVIGSSSNHITCEGFRKTRALFDPSAFVRFYAAPILANSNQPKAESKQEKGTRLNEKIKADFVRLVIDDEHHTIVSRSEALERARKLKLDLVEVDRSAKPIVCKIMDYHREKYIQQIKEKERTKSKGEGTLKKGSGKEIRFTEKTEKKDLQTKADTVKRLIDKGYRVKCMAVGTEDQDLGGMLARFSALIEDVAIVESGPMVEKKQAYVIVRHMKFGLKKSSSKKASTKTKTPPASLNPEPVQGPLEIEEELDDTGSHSDSEDDINPDQMKTPLASLVELPCGDREEETAWSTLDANEDLEELFCLDEEKKSFASSSNTREMGGETKVALTPDDVANSDLPYLKPELGFTSSRLPFLSQGHTQVGENGYDGGSEGRSTFHPTKSTERTGVTNTVPQVQMGGNRYGGQSEVRSRLQPSLSTESTTDNSELSAFSSVHASHVNRGPGAPNTVHQIFDLQYGGRQVPKDVSGPVPAEHRPLRTNPSSFGNFSRSTTGEIPRREQSHQGAPDLQYQGRQVPKDVSGPVLAEHRPLRTNASSFGNFSRSTTDEVPRRERSHPSAPDLQYQRRQVPKDVSGPVQTEHRPVRTNAALFGKFSGPTTDEVLTREHSHPSAPAPQRPSYGVFSAPKHVAPSRHRLTTEPSGDRGNSSLNSSRRPNANDQSDKT